MHQVSLPELLIRRRNSAFAGEVWQVALLGLQPNPSRRWPATQGIIDFRPVELDWLREIAVHWARSTRPTLQRLRETLRACQAASRALAAVGRTDPAQLGAGDFTLVADAIRGQRRADGGPYSSNHRNLLLYQFCQATELVNAGVSLETIRRRLGHANAQTVLRYADQRDTTADAEIRTWRRRKITGRPNS